MVRFIVSQTVKHMVTSAERMEDAMHGYCLHDVVSHGEGLERMDYGTDSARWSA